MTPVPLKELRAMAHSGPCHHVELFPQWNIKNPILTSTWYFTNCLNVAKWFQISRFIHFFPKSALFSWAIDPIVSYLNCSLSTSFTPPSPTAMSLIRAPYVPIPVNPQCWTNCYAWSERGTWHNHVNSCYLQKAVSDFSVVFSASQFLMFKPQFFPLVK